MAVFDLTLSNLKFANTDGFYRSFGTKKTREQNGGSLTSRECNENTALIFDTQRAVVVEEDSSTGLIEYNALFVVGDGLTLTLGDGGFTGVEVRVVSGVESNIVINGSVQKMPNLSCTMYFWNGSAWSLNTLSAAPLGFIYPQFPGSPSPDEIFVGEWENISKRHSGLFLRIEGQDALAFRSDLEVVSQNSTTLTFASDHGITTSCLLVDANTGERQNVKSVSGTTVTLTSAFSSAVSRVFVGQKEGLPNILGSQDFRGMSGGSEIVLGTYSGALYESNYSGTDNTHVSSSGTGSSRGRVKFDASKSNSIYGSSSHVTAANATMRLWQRIK